MTVHPYSRIFTGKTTAPTVNSDSSAGYEVGDEWIDEAGDKSYQAVDVTVGAAVWSAGGGTDVTLDANADTLLSLSTQTLGLDTQLANRFLGGAVSGGAAVPTFRTFVSADIPFGIIAPASLANASAQYKFLVSGATPFVYAESAGGLNIASGKIPVINNSITLAGTDGQTYTFPSAGGTVALLNAANVYTTIQTITPATDVVGLIINKSTTANALQVKSGATVLDAIDQYGHIGVSWATPGSFLPNLWQGGINSESHCIEIRSSGSSRDSGIFIRDFAGLKGLDIWQDGSTGGQCYFDSLTQDTTIGFIFRQQTSGAGPVTSVSIVGNGIGYNQINPLGTAPAAFLAIGGSVAIALTAPTTTLNRDVGLFLRSYDLNEGLELWYDGSADTIYFDTMNNLAAAGVSFRVRTKGTPVEKLYFDDNQIYFTQHTTTTNAVMTGLTLNGFISTAATGSAAGFGNSVLFKLETATADTMQTAGLISVLWTSATNGSQKADMVLAAYDTASREGIRIRADGAQSMVAIGGATASARLTLPAGTATASTAPLKFTAGTLMTAVEEGAMEFKGHTLYMTTFQVRRSVVLAQEVPIADVTVANTAVKTTVYSIPMAANYLTAGKHIDISLYGIFSSIAGPNGVVTITVEYAGATVLTFTTAAGLNTNSPFVLQINNTCRAIGSGTTGKLISFGEFVEGATSATETVTRAAGALTNIDTTLLNTIIITVQWASADAGNSITLQQGHTLCVDANT